MLHTLTDVQKGGDLSSLPNCVDVGPSSVPDMPQSDISLVKNLVIDTSIILSFLYRMSIDRKVKLPSWTVHWCLLKNSISRPQQQQMNASKTAVSTISLIDEQ